MASVAPADPATATASAPTTVESIDLACGAAALGVLAHPANQPLRLRWNNEKVDHYRICIQPMLAGSDLNCKVLQEADVDDQGKRAQKYCSNLVDAASKVVVLGAHRSQ